MCYWSQEQANILKLRVVHQQSIFYINFKIMIFKIPEIIEPSQLP